MFYGQFRKFTTIQPIFDATDGKRIAFNFNTYGTAIGLAGRPLADQPADLANGTPVYSVIAYNTNAIGIEVDELYYGVDYETIPDNVVSAEVSGIQQKISPVGLFIHESAEALAFRAYVNMYGSFDAGAYPYAHSRAILKEALIRADLHIAGGSAGAKVKYSVPHDKR